MSYGTPSTSHYDDTYHVEFERKGGGSYNYFTMVFDKRFDYPMTEAQMNEAVQAFVNALVDSGKFNIISAYRSQAFNSSITAD